MGTQELEHNTILTTNKALQQQVQDMTTVELEAKNTPTPPLPERNWEADIAPYRTPNIC